MSVKCKATEARLQAVHDGRVPRAAWIVACLALGFAMTPGAEPARAQTVSLMLPTRNHALYDGDGEAFYMYTNRRVGRRWVQAWTGGQYGFVRNVRDTGHGTVYTRFHEGADIRPVYRDAAGEPLDTVRAAADGEVVHVNRVEKQSNYGLYVVVEHWWGGSPYYTLYAHLNAVMVRSGQRVRQGDELGRLGYTGVGIDRARAHVHFEINLLLSRVFQPWYDDYFDAADPNYHGRYNGNNMAGIDMPAFYLALRDDPTLTVPAFLARQKPFFSVTVPNTGMPDVLWRYPWLSPSLNAWTILYRRVERPTAWVFYLDRSGLPLRIEPSAADVVDPVVTVLEPSPVEYDYLTKGLVGGSGTEPVLTRAGRRYVDLLTRTMASIERRMAW